MWLDSEDVKDMLDLYKLVKKVLVDLAKEYWSPKWARMIAENIAVFYKTLVEKGMPEDLAREITKLHVMDYKLFFTDIPKDFKLKIGNKEKQAW